ncbi:hypothetical protein A2U01_0084077 [Trifolium medium]|uniref:Uncharacterized protein n=1 Tax=Trifolium medium TaxID=97028 RepID=A0A392TRI8_9FABA|nr:hypothetical protein [Trifolium medium]
MHTSYQNNPSFNGFLRSRGTLESESIKIGTSEARAAVEVGILRKPWPLVFLGMERVEVAMMADLSLG